MIQRIQTVYLLIALILLAVCACLPIGEFIPASMGAPISMYNLCLISEENGWNFSVCGLFCLLAVDFVYIVRTIFDYNNRQHQAKMCQLSAIILLLWIVLYAILGFVVGHDDAEFKIGYSSILPVVAIVLIFLARRGVIADEKLVRAADRIR